MPRRRTLIALGCAPWIGSAAAAAPFPSRAIPLVVPFAPGGIADLTARAVAQALAASLGQAVVVDNRPGAGSIVASQAVAAAAPDGHTLLLLSNAHAVGVGLFKRLPFDVQRDFAPICTLASFDLGVFVAASSRWRTLADALAHARARPGAMTIGTVSVGSTQHLAAELFKSRAGIDALIVPYKGTPAVLAALRSGEIDIAFEILGPWLPQLRAGTLRALASTSSRRWPELPELPTLQEAGIAGYDVSSWNALAAPARTPPAVLARLNEAANDALRQPAVAAQLRALGVRPVGGTPQQLQQLLDSEIRRWGEVIRNAKIEPQ
jgi:tripartite-type tricarboxylate transporter receptor subunit TctC